MGELFLQPDDFQAQMDAFNNTIAGLVQLKLELDKQGIRLQSVDKYIECVAEYNKTLSLLFALLKQDTKSMKLIKAKWMNLDSDIATKTFGEVLIKKIEEE